VVGTSGANGAVINDNVFDDCGYYGVQNNQAGGQSPATQVQRNLFQDCNYGSEDGSAQPAGGNSGQNISNNTFRVVNPYGTGYGHSQAQIGGYSHGYLFVDPGTYASGSSPASGQYSGVTVSGNDMQGNGLRFFAGTNCTTNKYGAVISGNSCTNGCQCTQ
jgi:hypothetical protein